LDPKKKKGMSTAAKSTIAAVLGLAIIFTAFLVLSKMGDNKDVAANNALVAQAEDPTAKDLPTTSAQISSLLKLATSIAQNTQRQAVYQRILIAKASDGTDLDKQIAEFAANDGNLMISDIRVRLFEILQSRKSLSALPSLIEHAKSTASEQTAAAALSACEKIATDQNLADLLNIMRYTRHQSVRQEAKRVIAAVAKRTDGREALSTALKTAYETAGDDEVKRGYLELLGSAGGDEAATIVKSALADDDKKTQLAAVAALRTWPDDTMFEALIGYATGQEDDLLRSQSFEAAYSFLKLERNRDELDLEDMWKTLASEARTPKEKRQIIDGMAQLTDDWAFSVVEFFEEDDDDQVNHRAEQARERMETRRKRINGEDEEE